MPDAELMVELAGLETECPCCHNQEPMKGGLDSRKFYPDAGKPIPCSVCGGVGKVPLFEGVRKPCPHLILAPPGGWNHNPLQTEAVHPDNCSTCRGQGWVVRRDLETWMAASPYEFQILRIEDIYEATVYPRGYFETKDEGVPWTKDPDPLMALLLAISAGVKKER